MQTVTIHRYDQLTDAQWRRIATSAKRQVLAITGQISEIGIGKKYRDGRPSGHKVALRVYLQEKRKRVAKAKRIPAHFSIRLRRDDQKYELIRIRSDVESLGDYIPTGAVVSLGRRAAVAGFLLRWQDIDAATCWGFATVGHLFDGTSLRSATVRVSSSVKFQCRQFKSAPLRKHSDLALMEFIGRQDEIESKLIDGKLINARNQPGIKLMTVREVHKAAAEQRRGRTFSPEGDQSFIGEEVFPNGFLLGARRLSDCIRVGRSPTDTFRPGTSGSCWHFGNQVACMQVGGKATEFREGIGQPFQRFLPWIESVVGGSVEVVAVLT